MKKCLIVALLFATLCTACSTAWVSTLDSILAAAAPALINILQIAAVANGQPMNMNLEAKINADASVIKTLAADFAKASASAAPHSRSSGPRTRICGWCTRESRGCEEMQPLWRLKPPSRNWWLRTA